MARPGIRLGGVTVLAVGSTGWSFTTGTAAPMRPFLVHDRVWSRIESQLGQEVDLDLGQGRRVRRLVLVEEAPSPKPYYRCVLVSDIRYWWPRRLVLRDYNVRRRQNQFRISGDGPALLQLQAPIGSWGFLPSTLDKGAPWHAKRVIEDVLEVVEAGNWTIDSLPTVAEKSVVSETGDGVQGRVTVNDLRLRDPGDAAVQRSLNLAPGALVWIDASGKARVFDSTNLQEQRDFLASVRGPMTTAGGVMREVARRKIRPKAVHVYVERELEMLLRSEVEGTALPSNTDPAGTPADGRLINVAPVPDPRFTDPDSGSVLIQGTIVPLERLVRGWEADRAAAALADPGGAESGVMPYTMENVRLHFLGGRLEAAWGQAGDFLASTSGSRRVQCLRHHWRVTYKIEDRIMERLGRVAAVRLGILDDFTRTRAPATVFATYAIMLSSKGIYRAERRQDALVAVYQNVDAYPDFDGGGGWDDVAGVASAQLQLVDPELGVFRIGFTGDVLGEISSVFPGYLVRDTDSGNPEADPLQVFRALRFQGREPMILGGRVAEADGMCLYAGYQAAFLFSAVPSAPNGKERFHRIVVSPELVSEELATEFNVQESDGEVWELFAPPNLITARWGLVSSGFVWGEYLQALNELLGIVEPEKKDGQPDGNVGGGGGPPGTQGGASEPQGDAGGGGAVGAAPQNAAPAAPAEPDPVPEATPPWKLLNRGHLLAWAVAQAIPIYAGMADRTEGEPAFHWRAMPSDLRLSGGVRSLNLSADASGRLLAHVSLDGPSWNLDPVALLPQWARPQLLGVLLDQGKP